MTKNCSSGPAILLLSSDVLLLIKIVSLGIEGLIDATVCLQVTDYTLKDNTDKVHGNFSQDGITRCIICYRQHDNHHRHHHHRSKDKSSAIV